MCKTMNHAVAVMVIIIKPNAKRRHKHVAFSGESDTRCAVLQYRIIPVRTVRRKVNGQMRGSESTLPLGVESVRILNKARPYTQTLYMRNRFKSKSEYSILSLYI